jgi:hypothetical protein
MITMKYKIGISLAVGLLGTTLVSIPWLARAEKLGQTSNNCQSLKEIKSGDTTVRKVIQNPLDLDFKAFENNWNTDFAVPTATKFQTFTASLTPENEAVYDVAVNLKYNDDTTITVHDKKTAMQRGKKYTFPFESPNNRQPYQVNLKVKGDNNNAYTIAVAACR